jgi:hypothetical protein
VSKLSLLKQLIKEELADFMHPKEALTFEDNPLEFIIQKYPSLDASLTDLMTADYRDYITGIYVIAPKPTTFKILLHNGQEFYMIYGPRSYMVKVSGKKYNLINLNEEEFAIKSIAQLLELGMPPGSKGPDNQMENETPAPNSEAAPEETPAEEAPEEIKEGLKKNKRFIILSESNNIGEVSLSPTQLEKPYPSRSELSSEYKDRGERFLDKISNNDPFTLNDGSQINLDPKATAEAIKILQSKNYKTLGKGAKVFIDTEGNTYSLSQFKKTEEFGSGKGSGGGAAATATQESAQCLANSIAYHIKKGPISSKDLNDANMQAASKYIDVTASLEEIKSFLQEKSWSATFVNTANALLSKFPNSNFTFHRGSQFVTEIYNAFKTAAKKENISMQSDKWNPADIWLVDPSIESTKFPDNLSELNGLIAELLADTKLLGVSLKKLGGEAKISLYNMSTEELKGYTYESPPVSTNKSKDAKLKYNGGVIAFRTFNFATNFAGEILGKTASHGKVGTGAINDALKLNGLPALPPTKDSKASFESNDEALIKDFYKVYNQIVENINESDFMTIFNNKDMDWKVSKYTSLKLCSIIESVPTEKQNEFTSDLIRYASSSTKASSAFVKVS